ncbi:MULTISPECIES: S9 family peptidase [Shewanella]|uniref:S9 family peptidase n=1 Tax=Shewanella TaxID=22 RepID=UPI000647DF8A|nr:S9 family peptidase [Shewanella sp. ZOR0012]NSM24927.1 S9 family peptidase [Shewanella sp. ZOR0012]
MKKGFFWLVLTLFSNVAVCVEQLPVRSFFENSQVVWMKISPNGKNVAFTYEEGSEVRLAVMDLDKSKILSSFTFGENKHVVGFYWANDNRVLMEVTEIKGNLMSLRGNQVDLYAANIDGKKRDLIFKSGMSVYTILNLLPDDPDNILIGKYHWAEDDGMRAFKLNINKASDKFLNQQPKGVISKLMADNAGIIRLAVENVEGENDESFDDDYTYLHFLDGGSWQKLALDTKRDKPFFNPIGFSADNRKAYFSSNYDLAKNDTIGLFSYDFDTKKVSLISRHSDSDLDTVFYGHDGELLALNYISAPLEYDYLEAKNPDALLLAGLNNSFPGERVVITSFSKNGQFAIFSVSSDRNPGQLYLYDSKTKKARYLASRLPKLENKPLAQMSLISFKSRDGIDIHGLLTLPVNQDKNLPLIVNVHGGPFGVYDEWRFNPEAQFFANRGYATLQVNYRGSGGYGEDFEKRGRLQWGKAMQDDVTDATHWAIKQGIADASRICIYGGSYGGYAALWGVIKEPDLYKCSVGYVGVYDMNLFFNGDGSDASRSKSIMGYLKTHVGEGADYLKSISPVEHVDKIKADLFIVHGEKDVRVPIVHAHNLKKALDKIGKPYKWMVKEEGHGFYQVDNREALYSEMLAFFEKNIGKGAL